MPEKYIPAELRRFVAERAGQCCEYCRAQTHYSADSFTVDHIMPHSLNGLTTDENLALCCHGCNQHKSRRISALDPVTGSPIGISMEEMSLPVRIIDLALYRYPSQLR
jgi:hypothetical protein